MARLNISLPDDLYASASRWRGRVNLSEICARALRQELEAADTHRTPAGLEEALRGPGELERALLARGDLADAAVVPTPAPPDTLREALGRRAAAYLGREVPDGARLAVAGGRQTWCVVRNVAPRRARVTLTALGVRENDPRVLHAHANTLTTLLWLLYSPRADAHLVGARAFATLWDDPPPADRPTWFALASCAPLESGAPFAELLGARETGELLRRGARGDFAYAFLDRDAQPVPFDVPGEHSILSAPALRALAARDDARVLLVAGGVDKLEMIRLTLAARLANTLITDAATARALLE